MIKCGNKNFKTKETLTNYCKYILNNTGVCKALPESSNIVIDDVFKMHPNYTDKVKNLKYEIGIRPCSVNPRNKQFYITREDGTTTDFSYAKCITNRGKSTDIKRCLRDLVVDQTKEYKNQYFKENQDSKGFIVCVETGLKIKMKDSHVDHYPKQFDEIVKDWLVENDLSQSKLKTISGGDNCSGVILENEKLAESFKNYHQLHAQYRVVLNKVNQQRKRLQRYKVKES